MIEAHRPRHPLEQRTDVVDVLAGLLPDVAPVQPGPQPAQVRTCERGKIVDHWALSTAALDATVARLKREGLKFLEEIHPWGTTRAAMIEGPDRIAIELVEVK